LGEGVSIIVIGTELGILSVGVLVGGLVGDGVMTSSFFEGVFDGDSLGKDTGKATGVGRSVIRTGMLGDFVGRCVSIPFAIDGEAEGDSLGLIGILTVGALVGLGVSIFSLLEGDCVGFSIGVVLGKVEKLAGAFELGRIGDSDSGDDVGEQRYEMGAMVLSSPVRGTSGSSAL
jgi:hypothetical protein